MTTVRSQPDGSWRCCAGDFTPAELAQMRQMITSDQYPGPMVLACPLCHRPNGYNPDGWMDVSCSVALLPMPRDGLRELPAPARPPRYLPSFPSTSDPAAALVGSRSDLGPLQLLRVPTPPRGGC